MLSFLLILSIFSVDYDESACCSLEQSVSDTLCAAVKSDSTDVSSLWEDLGLSVLWANCNLGADSPEDFGNRYAWGEVAVKDIYNVDNYVYVDSIYNDYMIGVDLPLWEGTDIGYEISGTPYDVASVEYGEGIRIPTLSEVQELVLSCSFDYGKYKGVYGLLVTGPNGNQIFLPFRDDDGELYWCGTVNGKNMTYGLVCRPDGAFWADNLKRFWGLPIRPVKDIEVSESVF